MIGLETAQKLKDAGLMWEPKEKDEMFDVYGNMSMLYWPQHWQDVDVTKNNIWLPSLSQLLAEIETRGYGWRLQIFSGYYLRRIEIYIYNDYMGCFEADTTEEAVAQALIWILEQEAADI